MTGNPLVMCTLKRVTPMIWVLDVTIKPGSRDLCLSSCPDSEGYFGRQLNGEQGPVTVMILRLMQLPHAKVAYLKD